MDVIFVPRDPLEVELDPKLGVEGSYSELMGKLVSKESLSFVLKLPLLSLELICMEDGALYL